VRNKFNLPLNRKLILFAAANLSDKRKGIDYFIESCRMLAQAKEQPAILLMGGRIDGRLLTAIPLSVYVLGYLHTTEDICMAYTAADVYVTPSLSENLPNTVMEAMACGTPCVGFNTGGIPEMIDHKQNGYVAEYKNAKDLAAGIEWVLENTEKSGLADACVKKVKENYSETVVVGKYLSLYGNCNKIKNG
jgi:glycosyltransferase involved in cell wall biosynthesis